MDAISSIIAVVMVAVTSVSVGSIAEGKLCAQCLGCLYEVVTLGLHRGGTKDIRGVPKRHKANVGGVRRRRMRMALPEVTTSSKL
ncbi:hypothetical protein F4825DRAFT_457166 [Nemania diffusa]|nr:hypothetical protein F4825DRAFT_457166 [Nemania diffusa]